MSATKMCDSYARAKIFSCMQKFLCDRDWRIMNCVIRKPVVGFLTLSDTKCAIQTHKMVRALTFGIKEEEGLHYLCS